METVKFNENFHSAKMKKKNSISNVITNPWQTSKTKGQAAYQTHQKKLPDQDREVYTTSTE